MIKCRNPANLIYGGDAQPAELNVHQTGEHTSNTAQVDGNHSMYVELFEEMIIVGLGSESHLFSHDEIGYFKLYNRLSYKARFLLVRLSLRKADKWFRICELDQYRSELGDDIPKAMDELCANATKLHLGRKRKVVAKIEEKDTVIPDMKDEKWSIKREADHLKVKVEHPEGGPSDNSFESAILAENEEYADLPELLHCLNTDELRALAKSMKLDHKGKQEDILKLLQGSASKQLTLAFTAVPSKANLKGKNSKSLTQSQLTFGPKGQNQLDRLRQMAMKPLQKCIRINKNFIAILRRLHLVYYRCTQYSPNFMTPSVLARSKKRFYAEYEYQRTSDVWPSRDAILDYELALFKEFEIDQILAGTGSSSSSKRGRSSASRTPASLTKPVKGKGVEEKIPRVKNAELVKEIFESVYPIWKGLQHVKPDQRQRGLERFDSGYILTRVVCKGANALGTLKEFTYELGVLEALLSQRHWQRARRGRWHDRRALILMEYMPKDEETLRAAMTAVEEGIADPDTHTIWRPKLLRRLAALEKKLKIPPAERHGCGRALEMAMEITVIGERINSRDDAIHLDTASSPTHYFQVTSKNTHSSEGVKIKAQQVTGKNIWKGRDGEEISVEIFALQHYESLGYKGFHCEGSALYMIFGLLFWDIIFAPVPGAFETRYQTAPLDISHDTFYFSRQDIIHNRLADIKHGKAREILEATDMKYREKKTRCVGVEWDKFERQDLLEIVDCLGGSPLSEICRVVSEDYSSRRSGLPDLVIWDTSREENRCMFVEVKGPGDSLQENQKAWIHLLILAEAPVEVCRVAVRGEIRSRKRRTKKAAKKRLHESDSEIDELESEDDQSPPKPRKRTALPQKPSARKKRKLEPVTIGTRPVSPEL